MDEEVPASAAEIDAAFGSKEKVIRNAELIVLAIGEAIDTNVLRLFFGSKRLVEAFKQPTVHERDTGEKRQRVARITGFSDRRHSGF